MKSDGSSVLEISRGNEDEPSSFPQLYDDYAQTVRRALFKMCGTIDLDDLVQETFLRIWRGLTKFDGRSSMKTWIYSIAVNTATDHLRRRMRNVEVNSDKTIAVSSTNDEKKLILRDLVNQALQNLSVEHRITLILYVFEGLSLEEVAQVTNTRQGTIKSRLHYARSAVREFLERNGVRP